MQVWKIMKWEFANRVKTKLFILTTFVLPFFMIGLMYLPSLLMDLEPDENKVIGIKYTDENIIFLGTDNLIDTRSFAHVADAVITCAGSSGFELPAIGKLQSLIAGDCPYANVGFAIKPDTKEQYKDALIDLANGEKLSEGKHKDAMATFLFVHRLARVSMLAIPSLPNKEHINTGFS